MSVNVSFTASDWMKSCDVCGLYLLVPFLVDDWCGTHAERTVKELERSVHHITVQTSVRGMKHMVVSRVEIPRHTCNLRLEGAVIRVDHPNKLEVATARNKAWQAARDGDVVVLKAALKELEQLFTDRDPGFCEVVGAVVNAGLPYDIARKTVMMRGGWSRGDLDILVAYGHFLGGEVMMAILEACDLDKVGARSVVQLYARNDGLDDGDKWVCIGKAKYCDDDFYVRAAYLRFFGLTDGEVQLKEGADRPIGFSEW